MPHDKNGNELKAGDRVNLECEVISVTPSETYCNVTLKPVNPPNPPNMYVSEITANAAIVEKIAELETVGGAADE